jgi:Serine/threonine protein kinase
MQAERWQKIEQIFNASVKLPFHERESFVLANCGDDPELCQEIFDLIKISEKSDDDFLSHPIFSLGAQLLDQEFEELLNHPDFGDYRLQKILGRGGVGAVFIAEDKRLGRQVALKVLPSILDANDERVLRFQQEARTASSISHQNIAHIYEFGEHHGHYFLAMEYIEGKTLRQYLKEDRPDIDACIKIISQIAKALTAAHRAGIIHRDIKPENIMIDTENTVKVLDFGLAKPIGTMYNSGDKPSALLSDSLITTPGLIIGTAAYMSPEQAQGQPLDERTDLWSLGVLFYEMLSGKHPFHRESNIETLHAILKEEPQDLENFQKNFPPLLTRIVLRCLVKNRYERFQTANDFLFALESYQNAHRTSETEKSLERQSSTTRFWRWLAVVLAAGAVAAVVLVLSGMKIPQIFGSTPAENNQPVYKELTFQKGTIWAARFTPDGKSAVYSATLNGNAIDLFQVNPLNPEPRPMHMPETHLLSVSATGEMALLQPRQYLYQYLHRGTLVVIPVGGGTARTVAEDVLEADWSPDGEKLAVVRLIDNHVRLEYPLGKVLYETSGYINCPRVSPDGNHVAFLDHKNRWDNRGYVTIIDLKGQAKVLSGEWSGAEGLAWSSGGEEIWFTATRSGEPYALYAVTLDGKERTVLRMPVDLVLHDIHKDGRALLSRTQQSTDIYGIFGGETRQKNLSWLNLVGIGDLSNDGREFLFTNFSEGLNYATYVRPTDGAAATRLGEGRAMSFSPDGKYVLTKLSVPEQLLVLPVKEGEVKRMPHNGIERFESADWFADGENIIFAANEPGRARRSYKQNLKTGVIEPLTPEGIWGTLLAPDQKKLVATDERGQRLIYRLDSGEHKTIENLEPDEHIIGWHADGNSLFVFDADEIPIVVKRLDLTGAAKTTIRKIEPADEAGLIGAPYVFLTADGKNCLYGLRRYIDNLYLVEKLQ